MKLLLLSKHFTEAVNEKLVEALGKKPSEIKIVFSENAADGSYKLGEKPAYIDEVFEELKNFGYQLERIDLREYFDRQDELITKLKEFDAIFFSGGYYMQLLDTFYKTGLIDKYKELLDGGLVHIGVSAGALVTTKEMKYYRALGIDYDYNGVHHNQGLGLFPYYIFPHYSNKPKYTKWFEKAVKMFAEDPVKLIP
jgi:dipeptidase E